MQASPKWPPRRPLILPGWGNKNLEKSDKLTLVGFGTFSVSNRAARTGRNPFNGETIKIKAKKVAKFKASKELSGSL